MSLIIFTTMYQSINLIYEDMMYI